MMNKCNTEELEKFYNTILVEKKDSDLPEMINIIKMNKNDDEFYELCQKYVDIALNADRWLDKESQNLMCCNRFCDINIAAEYTARFINKYKISNLDGFLKMIEDRYVESISYTDTRKKAVFVPKKNLKGYDIGYIGQYVIFTDIPSWEQVKKDIIDQVVKVKV